MLWYYLDLMILIFDLDVTLTFKILSELYIGNLDVLEVNT